MCSVCVGVAVVASVVAAVVVVPAYVVVAVVVVVVVSDVVVRVLFSSTCTRFLTPPSACLAHACFKEFQHVRDLCVERACCCTSARMLAWSPTETS